MMPLSISKRDLGWVLLVAILSVHFALSYMTHSHPYLDITKYAQGQERNPFQYRALTSWLLYILAKPIDALSLQDYFSPPFDNAYRIADTIISTISIALSVYFTYRIILHFTQVKYFAQLASLLVIYMAYFNYILAYGVYNFSYPYDLPQLAFFSAALFFLYRQAFLYFYIVFVISTINRETSIFLLVFLMLSYIVNPGPLRKPAINWLIAGLASFALIKYLLLLAYGHNAHEIPQRAAYGGLWVWQLGLNLKILLMPQYWADILSNFGFIWLIVLFWFRYLNQDELKRCLWAIFPWIVGMMFVGRILEIRIFGELIPFITVVIAVIVRNRMKSELSIQHAV